MRSMGTRYLLHLLAAPAIIAGCKKETPAPPPPAAEMAPAPPPPQAAVSKIELGSSVGADKRVLAPRTKFGLRDSIIASVYTENTAPGATLKAVWTFQTGQVVDSTTQTVAASPAVTEFHIVKTSAWPVGKYNVAVSLNGAPAGSQDFEVAK